MKYIEQIKGLVARGEVQEASKNLLGDTLDALLGDPISAGRIIIALASSPFFIRDQLFWTKIEMFINGVYIEEDDCATLRAKLTENGEKQENALRLVECIDRAETQTKIRYLINATRCLLVNFVDHPTYFRICHAITHSLQEDLEFLSEHIYDEDIPYSVNVQGLLTSGLMYQSVIDGDGDQKYSFTPLAGIVDQYAVSYENIERYPNPASLTSIFTEPKPKLPGMIEWQPISSAEIDKLFSE